MLNLCPECHMPVSDKAEDCPHCGYVLRPRSGQPASAKAPGRVCEYCKMENPGDVMFCVSCGAPIKVAKAAQPQPESRPAPAPQPLNSGYSQQSSEVKIKYEKTERTFSSQAGTPVMINQGSTAPPDSPAAGRGSTTAPIPETSGKNHGPYGIRLYPAGAAVGAVFYSDNVCGCSRDCAVGQRHRAGGRRYICMSFDQETAV